MQEELKLLHEALICDYKAEDEAAGREVVLRHSRDTTSTFGFVRHTYRIVPHKWESARCMTPAVLIADATKARGSEHLTVYLALVHFCSDKDQPREGGWRL